MKKRYIIIIVALIGCFILSAMGKLSFTEIIIFIERLLFII